MAKRSPRVEIGDLAEEVVALAGGLQSDFDEGRNEGAALEAVDRLRRIIELFEERDDA